MLTANRLERLPTQRREDVIIEYFCQPDYRDLVSTRCGPVERDLRANAQLAVFAQVRDAGRQPKVRLGGETRRDEGLRIVELNVGYELD